MTTPEIPPAATEPAAPAKPNPIDVAIAAVGEATVELLSGNRPSRFGEAQTMIAVALNLQRLRPDAGVDEIDDYEAGGDMGFGVGQNPIDIRRGRRRVPMQAGFNDAADLNRQVIMLAQSFLAQYAEAEKRKADKPDPDVRFNEVGELAELYMLRLKLAAAGEDTPDEINYRITHLLKRVGAPAPGGPEHEPDRSQRDPALYPELLRGHQADGPGEPDGGGVGGALAERAGGDDGAR